MYKRLQITPYKDLVEWGCVQINIPLFFINTYKFFLQNFFFFVQLYIPTPLSLPPQKKWHSFRVRNEVSTKTPSRMFHNPYPQIFLLINDLFKIKECDVLENVIYYNVTKQVKCSQSDESFIRITMDGFEKLCSCFRISLGKLEPKHVKTRQLYVRIIIMKILIHFYDFFLFSCNKVR